MKKVCENPDNCAKINAVEELNRLHELHQEISREQGQIMARFDEIERFTESNLGKIKGLKHSVRQKQREFKQLADRLGGDLNRLLFG